MDAVHIVGLIAATISCGFWLGGAFVRFRPKMRGPDSIPAAFHRQSMLNAFAAIFAAIGAASQAAIFFLATT